MRVSARETRAGYRGVRRHLVREVWNVNLKRAHRIWKKEVLRVLPRASKKSHLGTSEKGSRQSESESNPRYLRLAKRREILHA